jgi:hypothetical protein
MQPTTHRVHPHVDQRIDVVGVDGQGTPETLCSLVLPAERLQRDPEVGMQRGRARMDPGGLLEESQSRFRLPMSGDARREIDEHVGRPACELGAVRPSAATGAIVQGGDACIDPGKTGTQLPRPLEARDRRGEISPLLEQGAEIVVRLGQVGVPRDRPEQCVEPLAQLPQPPVGLTQIGQVHGVVRVDLERALQPIDGLA